MAITQLLLLRFFRPLAGVPGALTPSGAIAVLPNMRLAAWQTPSQLVTWQTTAQKRPCSRQI
jgi:hypothetical protein